MARRSPSGNLFVGLVAGVLILVGVALYLRDRGLLQLPQPTQPAPAQRAEDLAKKYPEAEAFATPKTAAPADKKNGRASGLGRGPVHPYRPADPAHGQGGSPG